MARQVVTIAADTLRITGADYNPGPCHAEASARRRTSEFGHHVTMSAAMRPGSRFLCVPLMITAAAAAAACHKAGQFEADVAFLKQHTAVVVLGTAGGAQVVV